MTTTPPRTDDQWLATLRGGDETAIADLRRWLHHGLQRASAIRTRASAQDLDDFTQEATVRVLDRLGSYRGDSKFATWAMAVAVNHALTELRRRRSGVASLDDGVRQHPAAPQRGPGETAERAEITTVLQNAVQRSLTPHQRRAIELLLDGIAPGEAAERLGIERNAFHKLAHDARRRLRSAFHAAGFTDDDIRHLLEEGSS